VEAQALANTTSETIVKFIWEDIVYQHSCFGHLVVDRSPENKKYNVVFVKKYGIQHV